MHWRHAAFLLFMPTGFMHSPQGTRTSLEDLHTHSADFHLQWPPISRPTHHQLPPQSAWALLSCSLSPASLSLLQPACASAAAADRAPLLHGHRRSGHPCYVGLTFYVVLLWLTAERGLGIPYCVRYGKHGGRRRRRRRQGRRPPWCSRRGCGQTARGFSARREWG